MVYIQSDEERKLPHHFDASCALYGAMDFAQHYRLTSFEELSSGKFNSLLKTNLFVGTVEFMNYIFNYVGKTNFRLPYNSNRESRVMTLNEAFKLFEKGERNFIKPYNIKEFHTGTILDDLNISYFSGIDKETKVFVYEPFKYEILSEWRLYIYRGEIEDSHNYSGDFKISPCYDYAKYVINKFCKKNNFPVAYTIDIGILSNNENVVIEFNDMWAIGNYGMSNFKYFKLLRERYFEIMREL